MHGEVTNVQKGIIEVLAETGDYFRCLLRGRLLREERTEKNVVTVGDIVCFETLQRDRGVITEVLPRKKCLVRKGAGKRGRHLDQVIAANVDQVFIVVAVKDPPYHKSLIERYITAARGSDLDVTIVFNKADLGIEKETAADIQNYRELGYQVFLTSTLTGQGLEEVKESLKCKSSVLAGSSGVGKSSLVNAICRSNVKTSEVSASTHKGKHTTTSSQVHFLREGGKLIDVPGMREFALSGTEGLDEAFEDILELSAKCKFRDCTHTVEPGCAVRKAVEEGLIDSRRLKNYSRLKTKE
ncbi:MAG: ribosome small subunit-dependent GTPase A [Kosmotogaceae bacterium]|nr:ribosome small subunit-dependent GTPase A [Kosmotogaceae bacterium]